MHLYHRSLRGMLRRIERVQKTFKNFIIELRDGNGSFKDNAEKNVQMVELD